MQLVIEVAAQAMLTAFIHRYLPGQAEEGIVTILSGSRDVVTRSLLVKV